MLREKIYANTVLTYILRFRILMPRLVADKITQKKNVCIALVYINKVQSL